MTKKKTSRKKRQEDISFADTSDEELNGASNHVPDKCCPHVAKAVNFGRIKKGLKTTVNLESCSGCVNNNLEKTDEDIPEIWLCLQCGHRGCGRTSPNKHAMQHNKTLHSDCHSIVLSTSSSAIWCYDCDNEIQSQTSNLRQCVEFIMKFKTKDSSTFGSKSVIQDSIIQPSLNECSIKEDKPLSTEKAKLTEESKKVFKSGKKDTPVVLSAKVSVKGLRNLGNTCFFNAVMQNLCQTPLLEHELEVSSNPECMWEVPHLVVRNDEIREEDKKKLTISLPKQHPLAHSLSNFLKQMSITSCSNKADVINPSSLFGEISKKSPQFRHFQQQDSHELLRQLLDGVRQEEIKRQKKGILKAFNLANISPENVNEETKKLVKAYGCYASHTLIEKIFGGLLISTVLCEECKSSSQVFEPFMDLSLPVFEEKPIRNRKLDRDSDENISSEYILSKEKNDFSKPSKYQERKTKQQARKAKKKVKASKRGNESHCNENSEDVTLRVNLEELEKVNNDEVQELYDNVVSDEEKVKQYNSENEVLLCEKLNGIHNKVKVEDGIQMTDSKLSTQVQEQPASVEVEHSLILENDLQVNTEMSQSHTVILEAATVAEIKNTFLDEGQDPTENSQQECDNNHDSMMVVSLGLEDRIQTLCKQIKDVRIRRDSDRQENLLDSTESAIDCESQKRNSSRESLAEDTCSNGNGENWSCLMSKQHTTEWILRSLTTLKQRSQPSPLECSINSCLSHFTKSELLTGSNKFRCENCTNIKQKSTSCKADVVYTNASKQLLIFSPPAILTLHLKRFQQVGMSLKKVNRFVEFPLILDLAPYCSSASLILPHMVAVRDEVLYSLYGVVEHSGRLTSGHYTAFVRVSKQTLKQSFMNHWPLGQCDLEQLLEKFSKMNSTVEENDCDIYCSEACRWYYISDSHVREVNECEVLKCQAYILFYQRIK